MYEEIIDLSTYYYNKTQIDNLLNGKANSYHIHNIGNVSGLQSALNGKSDNGHGHSAGSISGLATVATSGSYNDLTDKPSSGGGVTSYNDLTDKPNLAIVATSGNYNDLTNKPTIPPGSVVDNALSSTSTNPVQNKVVNTALNERIKYSEIINDLESDNEQKPLSAAQGVVLKEMINSLSPSSSPNPTNVTVVNSLNSNSTTDALSAYQGKVLNNKITNLSSVATSGNYDDLTDKPNLATVATSGNYNDLDGKPSLASVATSGNYNDLNNKPTIPTETNQLTNNSGYVTTSDLQTALNKKSDSGHNHGWTTEMDSPPHCIRRNDGARLMEAYGYFPANVSNTGIGTAQYPTILFTCSYPPPISLFQGSRPGVTVEMRPTQSGFEMRYYSTGNGSVNLYYHFMWSY